MHRGRVEQALGRLAQDHEVDASRARIGKSLGRVRIGLDRADTGIEAVAVAESQVRADLGAVRVADAGQADRAEKDRIGCTDLLLASGLDVVAGLGEMGGPRLRFLNAKR